MVLASLKALQIRGEYCLGPDTGDLDNVSIVADPKALASEEP